MFAEDSTSCTIYDITPGSTQRKINFVVRPRKIINEVFNQVATQFPYESFELVLKKQDETVFLNDKKDKNLCDIPGFVAGTKNTLYLMPTGSWENNLKKKIDLEPTLSPVIPDSDPLSDDDLALGASASPVEPESLVSIPPTQVLPIFDPIDGLLLSQVSPSAAARPLPGYVGLVNQAMTCYLNSLLQALFMTPEFRNALYKRKFDNIDEEKCIPYQLQKLFLNLQTSSKMAVETTDLTRSFGWDSTEAWHQHDIQELCRVMFDALECKFKGTEQENLINNLYEGKMIDYVKCLECNTEKSREDTFLDIPLPVRPFGSSASYGSVEEALRAFVQPETLDGNNQYFCERCNKKCDAHKGLKFKTFPYILTLHLKRFDFDYQTLHRIKLNDKVTFPQTLNLNSLINATDSGAFANLQNNNQTNGFISSASSEHENAECIAKYDDCSTTDSGAALEEDNCSGIATTASSSHHENELQEDDEGIDMSASLDNRMHGANESGPYEYELFAIMIHSGSASGGHYYAYIKEFENGEWYCFNDQSVSPITHEDIQKSYGGGGSFKGYYSGIYSSSTNAYMLMYRQLDPKRNERAMKTSEFPEHIQKLLQELHEKEQEDKRIRPSDSSLIKPIVHFYNPKLKQMKEKKVYIARSSLLKEVLDSAHRSLDVQEFAPLSRCRLVAYNPQNNEIERSLEERDDDPIGDVLNSLEPDAELLLEIRAEDEEFDKYEPGGVTVEVFKIDIDTCDVDGPYMIRSLESDSTEVVKKLVAKKVRVNAAEIVLLYGMPALDIFTNSDIFTNEKNRKIHSRWRIFFTCEKNPTRETEETFKDILQKNFAHFTYLYVPVPNTDPEHLEKLGIPKYEPKQQSEESSFQTPKQSPSENRLYENNDVVDAVLLNGAVHSDQGASGDFKRTSPLPAISVCTGHESNSEDSSLSDGDRTLVESALHDSSHVSSTSHSPQLSSPEDESVEKIQYRTMLTHDLPSDDEDDMEIDNSLYFRAYEITENSYVPYTTVNGNLSDSEDNKDKVVKCTMYKVFVDKRMKIGSFKRALEPYIGVPAEYFKIVRKQADQFKLDSRNMSECSFKDGEQVKIELGRNLKKGESKAKIYYLKLSELTDEVGKLPLVYEWIFKLGTPITEAKRELVAQLHKIDAKYQSLTLDNCRLWEKCGKTLVKVYSDHHYLSRVSVHHYEIIVQECEEGINPEVSEDHLILFVRRWYPSRLELGKFQEIFIDVNSDIKKVLSSISDIPEDKVAYNKLTSSFPCTNISVFGINAISWSTNSATLKNFPLSITENGQVFFYKNISEPAKDLTPEERRELNKKEKARLDRIGGACTSLYSPRKERALKIYLEK